jgi:hypothetical protein
MLTTEFDFTIAFSNFKKHLSQVKSVSGFIDGMDIDMEMVCNIISFWKNNINQNIGTTDRQCSTQPDAGVSRIRHLSHHRGDDF